MEPKSLPLPLEEELFLEQSTQLEKILYILWKNGITRQDKLTQINANLPGIIRKSSRTFYKIYNNLIKDGKIKKVKELENERRYFAYKITNEGEIWLLGELKRLKDKIESDQQKATLQLPQGERIHPLNDPDKQINSIKTVKTRNTQQISLEATLQKKDPRHNKKKLPHPYLETITAQQRPISEEIHVFKRLTNVLEKIEQKLDKPISSPTQSPKDDTNNLIDYELEHYSQPIEEEDFTSDSDDNYPDEENTTAKSLHEDESKEEIIENPEEIQAKIYLSLQTKSNLELLKMLEADIDNDELQETILNQIIFTRNHPIEEKIKLFIHLSKLYGKSEDLREALFNNLKLGEEDLQKFVSILSLNPSEEEEDAIWEIISPKTLQNETKISIFIHLMSTSRNLNYNRIQRLIRMLQLKGENLVNLIENPKEYSLSHPIVLILLDIMTNQLIVQRSIGWDSQLEFSFRGEKITKKQFVVYYIEQSFLSGVYNRTLAIIELLKQQNEFTLAEAQIELLILLNLRNYDQLEHRIQEYEILTNKSKLFEFQEELGYIAFRTYYEQPNKLTEIALNPDFEKKWKLIAKLEKDLSQENIMWIDESDIKSILARLSPLYNEQYRLFPTRPLTVFYHEHLIEENVLLYFTPHFTRWLHTQGPQGEKDSILILRLWWENRFRVIQFLNLQEEILQLLVKWDREFSSSWAEEIKHIKQEREQIENQF
ncbi:hypothetical protein NEF87_000019 [Candidatus Lokiarchaeum ossiferum]|uniref:Transcription regulator PadR N-terminal domain-containing protein n=1 Tax=Candidatus Lokiarchaeum ossiferum TaxID=2951803 RepID=A0ABY6HJN8_9ARCH|nr:hypothetical protein NEF87_000019 [Candidatus Lokiarchaeum sp. B-35]